MIVLETSLGVEKAYVNYKRTWQALLVSFGLTSLEPILKPTTLSVKVADKAALYKLLQDNAQAIEQVHIGTVNDRYIASTALKEPIDGLSILKVLERRPGSADPLGLDSIDYLVEDLEKTYTAFQLSGAKIVKEHNDMHAWLSLRFGEKQEFEAKFTDHLVLEVGIKELNLASQQIRQQLS